MKLLRTQLLSSSKIRLVSQNIRPLVADEADIESNADARCDKCGYSFEHVFKSPRSTFFNIFLVSIGSIHTDNCYNQNQSEINFLNSESRKIRKQRRFYFFDFLSNDISIYRIQSILTHTSLQYKFSFGKVRSISKNCDTANYRFEFEFNLKSELESVFIFLEGYPAGLQNSTSYAFILSVAGHPC